jgi:hypothetical protein
VATRKRIKTPAKKPSQVEARLAGATAKKRKLQRSPEQRAEELKLQRAVFDLTVRGLNRRQIAATLNVPVARAARLVSRALDEALSDRDEIVHLYLAKGIAQADALIRTWMPRAMGYQRVDANGRGVVNEDGTPAIIEPDTKAAMLVARVLRDRNMLINYGTTVKVEHSGVAGGPIMTAHMDARAAAAIVRDHFANAPQVILTEDQSVADVPELAKPN